jgi:hypothetical protein
VDPIIARKTFRTLEPLHGLIYFAPEADEAYSAVGLKGNRMGYFASRAAAMGAVPAEVVIATFYNFNPSLVADAIPDAWALASPDDILEARLDAADRALRRALPADGLDSPAMTEAAGLARRAARAAATRPQGRPLFAAHASRPWPEEPHLVLWHAQTLLREFRGDGHVAALLLAGLDPVEALITHAASGDVPAAVLQETRAWPDEVWAAGVERLRSRGVLEAGPPDELTFTEQGRQLRQHVEDQTDAAAVFAYEGLGEDGCERLRQLARPMSQAVVAAGLIPVDPRRFLEGR